MAENKTKPTEVSAEDHIAAIANETRRNDCESLVKLMSKITRHPPIMWGSNIVGFDSYHYKYASGREGDMCITGFASRKGDISVYLLAKGPKQDQLLEKLGKHKMGKSCLYIRRIDDVDVKVLEQLITDSVTAVKALYGS